MTIDNKNFRNAGWGIVVFSCFINISGCADLSPRYERPPLPVPTRYSPQAARTSAQAKTAETLGWQDYFLDEKLRVLIEQALINNRDLRTAIYHIQEARALYGIQRSDQLPTFNANADFSRGRLPEGFNITGRPPVSNQYQVSLASTAWELDFWGRVHNLTKAAFENYLATEAAQKAAAISLITEVANSYLRLCELDERITLAKNSIASRQESFNIFKRQFEEGRVSNLDLSQVKTLLAQAQSLEVQLEEARAIEVHALSYLTGYSVEILESGGQLNENIILFPLDPGSPSELLANRPDIIAAEHQLRAAHANIGAARAAFFPHITLFGTVGEASIEFNNLFTPESLAWNFGPKLSVPLFDAGRNRNNLSLAEARRNVSVAQYEKTIQTAFREVSDALSSQQWLIEQLKILKTNLDVQKDRAHFAQLRYQSGTAPFLEILDAERDLFTAEQQLVQAWRALLSSRVLLYSALGGGLSYNETVSSDNKKE